MAEKSTPKVFIKPFINLLEKSFEIFKEENIFGKKRQNYNQISQNLFFPFL